MKTNFTLSTVIAAFSMLLSSLAYANKHQEFNFIENKQHVKPSTDEAISITVEKIDYINKQAEKKQPEINNIHAASLINNNFNIQDILDYANKKHNKADDLLMSAMGLLGINYRYGGSSPINGFDCSGFLQFIFKESLNVSLPRTSRAMAEVGKEIGRDHLQAGDLVFFRTTKRAYITHVGMYVGNGHFIHAPRTGKSIEIQSMKKAFYDKRFVTARRVAEINKQVRNLGMKR